jgi:nucleotide-binding universal stress UspA family protein
MSKREILVLDDFTDNSEHALKMAGLWKDPLNANIASLHVSHDEKEKERSRATLRERAERYSPESPVKALIGEGNLFNAIREGYLKEQPAILMFCTHGVKGLRQMLFGANSTRVVDDTSCPNLVIQQNSPAALPQNWLICGNTFWDDLGLNRMSLLAGQTGARCTLLRIALDAGRVSTEDEIEVNRWSNYLGQSGLECSIDTCGREGFGAGLAHQIFNIAEAGRYDLIVMSRHGYNLLGKAAYDADRESLINNPAGIPVLFI